MRLSEILEKAFEKVLVEKIAAAILLGVAAAVTLVAHLSETWGLSVMYGFGAGAFASMIYYFALRQPAALATAPGQAANEHTEDDITPDNVRETVRDWLDSYGVNVRMLKPDEAPQTRFAMVVTPQSNVKVTVLQTKKDERYLQLQASIMLGDEHREALAKLTEEHRVDLYEGVGLELARARLSFKMKYPIEDVQIVKRIPITPNLTEVAFIDAFSDMETAGMLAVYGLRLGLRKGLDAVGASSSGPTALDTEPPPPAARPESTDPD